MPGRRTSPPKLTHRLLVLVLTHASIFMTLGAIADLADLRSQYIAESWKKERGLPDNSINTITQTPDGYLWIATRAGLARFDGARFVVFNRANSPQMPSDEVLCVTPGDGDLWVGTTGGLSRFSPSGIATWLTGYPDKGAHVTSVFVARKSGVWVSGGIGAYQIRDGQLEKRSLEAFPALEEADGRLWLANRLGFWRFDPFTGKTSERLAPPDLPKWGVANSANAVRLSNETLVAHFGQHRQANYLVCKHWLYAFKDGLWTRLSDLEFSNGGRSFWLATDGQGAAWLPNCTNGLVRYKDGELSRLSFLNTQISDYPTCVFHDREGNIWVGTEESGLLRFRPRKVRTLAARDSLPHDNTWTLCESRDGSVWIGTDGGIGQLKDGRIAQHTEHHGLAKNTVRSIVEDQDGVIWAGTGHGLSCYRDGAWQRFPLTGELSGNKIRVLYSDRSGDLWAGTERGLTRIRQHQVAACPEPLMNVDVRALWQDRLGALWIGSYGRGLFRAVGERFEHFSTTNGLASDSVWAFHEDSKGALWFGSDRGLHRYRAGRFAHFTRREGLPHDEVNHILEDDSSNLWISSDHGIYRLDKQQLEAVAAGQQSSVHSVVYDTGDGLLSAETNGQKSQPAGCKTRDGRLWFPTTRGVVVFDPKNLPDNPNPPRVVIEEIRADGQSIFHNGPSVRDASSTPRGPSFAGVKRFATLDSELRLAPGSAHVLEIQYAANTFIEADKVGFKYRLDGLDRDWIEAGHRRFAHYANLKPGHYRFRLMAVNKYGVAAKEPSGFAFYLRPHFYQTKVFYALWILAVGLSALILYRWRLGYLRRIHRLEQERVLAEDRARIAKDLHDGLGAQLTNLSILADISEDRATAVGSHETRFRKLSQLARETALQLREIIWTNHPGDESLEGLVSRICQYAQQSLDVADIRCCFEIAADLPPGPLNGQARHHLYLTAKEILHNILKHASATEVRIRARILDGSLEMVIEDNGNGFISPPTGQKFPNGGYGLQNMRRRIESLNGTLSMTSEPGRGVRLVISVPLKGLFSAAGTRIVVRSPTEEPDDHASLDRRG